jgi:hypothetical protein
MIAIIQKNHTIVGHFKGKNQDEQLRFSTKPNDPMRTISFRFHLTMNPFHSANGWQLKTPIMDLLHFVIHHAIHKTKSPASLCKGFLSSYFLSLWL